MGKKEHLLTPASKPNVGPIGTHKGVSMLQIMEQLLKSLLPYLSNVRIGAGCGLLLSASNNLKFI